MAQRQRPGLPDTQLNGNLTEVIIGSKVWVRRITEKFRSSRRIEATAISSFGSEVVDLTDQSAIGRVYNLRKDIFLAERDAVPVPPEAKRAFEDTILSRLETDLKEAWRVIESNPTSKQRTLRTPNQNILERAELRMSGKATGGRRHGRVELVPTIWVRCPESHRADMERALDDGCMKWAHECGFGRVMVGDAAKLRSTDIPLSAHEIPRGRGISLDGLDDFRLHIEIEDPSSGASVEGVLCRVTLMQGPVVRSQKHSTLGGVLDIGGRPFGVTSAHAILGNLWDSHHVEDGSFPRNDPVAGESDDAEMIGLDRRASPPEGQSSASSQSSLDEDDLNFYAEFAKKQTCLSTLPSRKWIEVDLGDVANFLGLKALFVKGDDGTSSTVVFVKDVLKSDFALLSLDRLLHHVVTEASQLSTSVVGYEMSDIVGPGPVLIRLRDRDLEGTVLSRPARLDIFGISVSTQYIQLRETLPLGASGAWAVRDGTLCGMVIAGYDHEPYAHMIPASRLVADIKKSIPDTPSIAPFKGSLAKGSMALEDPASPSVSASQGILDSSSSPMSLVVTPTPQAMSDILAPSQPIVTLQRPPATVLPSPHINLEHESEEIEPREHTVIQNRSTTPRTSTQRATGTLQRGQSRLSRLLQSGSVRLNIFLWRIRRSQGVATPDLSDDSALSLDQHEPTYRITSPRGAAQEAESGDRLIRAITQLLDPQNFNKPLALLASLEYFASWYNLFALNLATSAIDFVHSDPEVSGSNTGLGPTALSGLLVLLGMAVGMLVSGHLATFYGRLITSFLSLGVLLFGIIGLLVMGTVSSTSSIIYWQVIMGLGIGSLSLLPAVAVVECASTKTRSRMLALVLSMQAAAQLAAYGVGAVYLSAALNQPHGSDDGADKRAVDQAWRLIIGLGMLPVMAAVLLRLFTKVPESPRFLLATNNPDLALEAAKSLYRGSKKALFDTRVKFWTWLWQITLGKTGGETSKKRESVRQWSRGLHKYLFAAEAWNYYLGPRYHFRLVLLLTISWFLSNAAFFSMGLDNPQSISSWGITSPSSALHEYRPRYYLGVAGGSDFLQSCIVVLQFLSGPAIAGCLFRILLLGFFSRNNILNASSFPAAVVLAVFGGVLYARQNARPPELESGQMDGVFVLSMYSLFQFAMNLAPSALQFAFATEIIATRYRTALLGTSSAIAMLGAIAVRALVMYVDGYGARLSYSAFLSAGVLFYSRLVLILYSSPSYTRTEEREYRDWGTRLVTMPLERITGEVRVPDEMEMRRF